MRCREGGTIDTCARACASRSGDASRACTSKCVDTGVGMDEETRRRCLEPFFTTKGERGTGLGLAMVYGMAKRHSAGLEIDSALGEGTTIRLTFRAGTAQTSPRRAARPTPLFATRSLRMLLVDDDPVLIESLRSALRGRRPQGHDRRAAARPASMRSATRRRPASCSTS